MQNARRNTGTAAMHGQKDDERVLPILHDLLTFVGSHCMSPGNYTPLYDVIEISKDRFTNRAVRAPEETVIRTVSALSGRRPIQARGDSMKVRSKE